MKMELVEAIRQTAQSAVNGMHTAFPGVILDIDYEAGTCSIQPYALIKTATGENMTYPTLYNVPIVVPQSSTGAVVAYPIVAGDTCMVIVSEGTLDYWRFERVTELDSKFELNNAVCIPGLARKFDACFKEAVDDGAVILKYGAGKIKLTGDTVTIAAKNLTLSAENDLTLTAGRNVDINGTRVDIN